MSDEFQDFPVISSEVIAALDTRFPDKMPSSSADYPQICYLHGTVEVVRLLKRVRDAQNDNILAINRKVE